MRSESAGVRFIFIAAWAIAFHAITIHQVFSQQIASDLEAGAEAIREGRWEKGRTILLRVIKEIPGDEGSNIEIDRIPRLSEERLSFGREQVNRLLADRPNMKSSAAGIDRVLDWAARQFAGEGAGAPMLWSSAEPEETHAEHYIPVNGEPGAILIASRKTVDGKECEREFEELWVSAVFELINCGKDDAFLAIDRSMRKGEFSKDNYVKANFDLEFKTAQDTRGFYVKHFLPILAQQGEPSEPRRWYVSVLYAQSSQECFAQFRNRRAYPWSRFGAAFDKAQAKREKEHSPTPPAP